jgi:hypothetical protein
MVTENVFSFRKESTETRKFFGVAQQLAVLFGEV